MGPPAEAFGPGDDGLCREEEGGTIHILRSLSTGHPPEHLKGEDGRLLVLGIINIIRECRASSCGGDDVPISDVHTCESLANLP